MAVIGSRTYSTIMCQFKHAYMVSTGSIDWKESMCLSSSITAAFASFADQRAVHTRPGAHPYRVCRVSANKQMANRVEGWFDWILHKFQL